jgi:RimJ/RimL family protein N-acetyltransferase
MHKMLLEIPSELETERLILRPYQKGDGKAFFSLLQNNYEHLKEHVDEATDIKNEEEAEIRVRELASDWVARNRFVMVIEEKESHTYIGQKYREGEGIITEAARRCLTFLFEDLNAHKVVVKARETNVRSFRVAERCNFVKEGLLRDHARIGDNEWVGLLCYGMLRSEYETLKKDWD